MVLPVHNGLLKTYEVMSQDCYSFSNYVQIGLDVPSKSIIPLFLDFVQVTS